MGDFQILERGQICLHPREDNSGFGTSPRILGRPNPDLGPMAGRFWKFPKSNFANFRARKMALLRVVFVIFRARKI